MKKILSIFMLLVSLITYSQVNLNIDNSDVVVTSDTNYGSINFNGSGTLILNEYVDVQFSSLGSNAKIKALGYNTILVNGTLNSGFNIQLLGNVCMRVTGQVNGGGSIVGTNSQNYLYIQSNVQNNPTFSGVSVNQNSSTVCNPFVAPCSISVTWNGTTWSSVPTTQGAIINGNYSGASFSCCSLTVNSDKTLIINSGVVVTVTNNIINNGNIIVESGGSLVQVSDVATFTGNDIAVKRTTTPLKMYDYTYWSTPVINSLLSAASNGTDCYAYQFDSQNTYNWMWANLGDVMINAKGYIVRASEEVNYTTNPTYTATFTGKPNNGVITIPIYKQGNNDSNLVGNPYPSALDAKLFIQANANVITGTLYFWTHNSAIALNSPNGGSGIYNYTRNDYASYNLTGGVGSGNPAITGGSTPSGYIASGQGFFLEKRNNSSDNIVFNNSMRITANSMNGQFYRTANNDYNRIWLNLSNSQGAYSEILLGYVSGAADGFDYLYDGKTNQGENYVGFYQLIDGEHLTIQGKSIDFDINDVITLGFSVEAPNEGEPTTEFRINVNQFDGFFDTQDVFLVDKLLNVTTNIKNGDYLFTSEAGVFNERFELRFTTETLGVDEIKDNFIMFTKDGNLLIESNDSINSVIVYDILGRILYEQDVNSNSFNKHISSENQIILVKVTTDKGSYIKKLFI